MYKLNYFVPAHAKENTKNALFAIGVGSSKKYEKAAFETLGRGQFQAKVNAEPHIGTKEELTIVEEYKVEMLCTDELITKAVALLKETHPYEEVAYEVIKLEDF
jgi:hypothetical protein